MDDFIGHDDVHQEYSKCQPGNNSRDAYMLALLVDGWNGSGCQRKCRDMEIRVDGWHRNGLETDRQED